MEIYTDGSHSLKPRMSGVGVVIIDNGREHQIGAYTNKCVDNNVAEVMAIAFAIKYICDNKIVNKTKSKTITIFSDSANALRKIKQNSPGKDEYEQASLDYIHDFLYSTSKKVSFFQIKGHAHDGTKLSYNNNIADNIAGEYRLYGLEKYKEYTIKKMIKYKKVLDK